MEYSALVHNSGYGSLPESAQEVVLIDELFVEGCWLETTNSDYYLPSSVPNQDMYNHEKDATSFPFQSESTQVGKSWWIGPSPSSSVNERLVLALGYLKEYTKNTNVLIQIWVPPIRRHHHHHPSTLPLEHYKNVSRAYNQENSEDRIFLGKVQEWTPVVRFFKSHEYPHINFAHQYYDDRASLVLPVFERGTGTCLGVVDILMTNQNISRSQLDNVRHSLQAVDFRSCQNLIHPAEKVFDELYQAALNEIVEVLTSVVKTYNLPLALTWAPCIQQGKSGCGPNLSDQNQNYGCCVSTVDSACFVGDLDILIFQEACCECHLFRGQGIVGTALITTKPCFASDITAFSKAQYPLAPHAAISGLRAAVAIPLQSVYTGPAEFVLELFLPKDCHDTEQQKQMLNSLSMVIQQACRSLHVIMDKEFEQEPTFPSSKGGQQKEQVHNFASCSEDPSPKESSWVAHMMEAQQKGKGVSVSLEYLDEAKEEFKVTTNWDSNHCGSGQVFSDYEQLQQNCGSRGCVEVDGGGESYNFGGRRSSRGRKSGEKRQTKAEKTIGLSVLRQYFAGSLKDAAKSMGVCPTTLKRICRQHGITRWPSRKIKKVGHSLKKLQLVIDSVQGAEGAIQIGSFYSSFPELSSGGGSCQGSKITSNSNNCRQMYSHPKSGLYSKTLKSKSPRQTCYAINEGGNLLPSNITSDGDGLLERAHSDAKHLGTSKSLECLPHLLESSSGCGFRVKATLGDEKIRFSLQQNWGFRDLQMEIARRFNLNDLTYIDLKYLDDDGEWVLLTCDADIEECKDIHTSSQSHTIRLSLFQASPLNIVNTFGSSSSPSYS